MAADYKTFYSAELRRLRHYSQEFARDNPALAPLLGTPSVDPDIERLLEGVAFLNGHTRQKLNDEFPEIAQELASILVPQMLRPVPAATMMIFEPKASLKESAVVPRGTEVAGKPLENVTCRFRTTVDVEVSPLRLLQSQWLPQEAGQMALRLELQGSVTPNGVDLPPDLRFFLGDNLELACSLFMLLQQYRRRIDLIDDNGNRFDISDSIAFPGFDEQLIPQPVNGVPAFGLVRELLSFPEKFLFITFKNLADRAGVLASGRFSIEFQLNKTPHALPELSANSFLLHATPAVNLFAQSAEPVNLTHETTDYLVLPSGLSREHHQIFSIDSVIGLRQGQVEQRQYGPFAMLQYGNRDGQPTYRTSIQPAMGGERVETYLSVVYEPNEVPKPETLSIELTCTNRWLAEQLKPGEVSEATNTSPERCGFHNITPVKGAVDAPTGETLLWACISHTAMNFMSLGDTETTRSLLNLYNSFRTSGHSARAANERQIEGIRKLETHPENRIFRGSVIRGQVIKMVCDQSNWPSVGTMYVWGCVLARFFATYATINTYTRFEMSDSDTGVEFKWPPMLGNKPLV